MQLIHRPWRDGRLSWLAHSGEFTHKLITCHTTDLAKGRVSLLDKDRHPNYGAIWLTYIRVASIILL